MVYFLFLLLLTEHQTQQNQNQDLERFCNRPVQFSVNGTKPVQTRSKLDSPERKLRRGRGLWEGL